MEFVDSTREERLARRGALAHLIPFLSQQSCAALDQANQYAHRLVSWATQLPFTLNLAYEGSPTTYIRHICKRTDVNDSDESIDAMIVCDGDNDRYDDQNSAAAAEVASDCVDYMAVLLASQLDELISHTAPSDDQCI